MPIGMNLMIEKEIRETFVQFCNNKGTNLSSAINYLIRKSVDYNTLPIQVDEILSYQKLTNDQKKAIYVKLPSHEIKEDFQDMCSEYTLSMTAVLEILMRKCVEYNTYPI